LFIDKYLLEFIVNLGGAHYFEKEIWEKIIKIVNKKHFKDVEK
jgi:hypothetical protein